MKPITLFKKICILVFVIFLTLKPNAALAQSNHPAITSPAVPVQVPIDQSGNPIFPLITNEVPFVDTTGMAGEEFLKNLQNKLISINQKGYRIGGFSFDNAPNKLADTAKDFGNVEPYYSQSGSGSMALVVSLNKSGEVNKLKPAVYLATDNSMSKKLPSQTINQLFGTSYTPVLKATGDWELALLSFVDALDHELDDISSAKFRLISILIILFIPITIGAYFFTHNNY